MKQIVFVIIVFFFLTSCINKNDKEKTQAEKQISFALESKPHSYYVEQSILWWKEIERDSTSEENWFNYYRACRNAQGTADWREDFVDESPYLRLGDTIVSLMQKSIPQSFTYNYVKGSTGAVDASYGAYLLKAYEMDPDFPGIQAAMVTYSVSTHNLELRKEVNKKWKRLNTMNPGLLQYSRNVLVSIEPNAILLTQHDNDSYPAWLLQDAYELKPDVLVLNIDFLLLESFRKNIFEKLGIPPFELKNVNVNEYRTNWKNVIQHFLGHYNNTRPLYIGLTVSPEWYEGFEGKLHLNGLTNKFTNEDYELTEINKTLFKEVWDLEDLNVNREGYYSNKNVIEMNINYIRSLNEVHNYYMEINESDNAEAVRQTALEIAYRTNNKKLIARIDSVFKNR
ncbi:MAG: hypothetical protein JXR07_15070 [Reichenbachiella sp.]